MSAATEAALAKALLARYGRTYAEEAGIGLADRPSPLYRLLVLSTLLSARISADIAIAAARELSTAGYRTPRAMSEASWQDRVDALGRGHYRRYDERTSTMLGDGAALLCQRWRGDLRRLRQEAGGDARQAASLLTGFPGIGPAGANIFLREVQAVWPEFWPYLDRRVLAGAERIGLPDHASGLASLAGSAPRLARLAAGLVRVSLRDSAAAEIRNAAGEPAAE